SESWRPERSGSPSRAARTAFGRQVPFATIWPPRELHSSHDGSRRQQSVSGRWACIPSGGEWSSVTACRRRQWVHGTGGPESSPASLRLYEAEYGVAGISYRFGGEINTL